MAKIAILDDRKDHRDTVRRSMEVALASFPGWSCCECPVLDAPDNYLEWIVENNVQVLLVDQVLNEQGENVDLRPVHYKGHDVIAAIREHVPDFPIFIVTAVRNDPDLQEHLADAEEVIKRTEFGEDPRTHLARMTRAGQRFAEANTRRLARLSELAKKSAAGTADAAELEELRGLQQGLAIAVTTETALARDVAIRNLEAEVDRLEHLCRKIKKVVDQKK
jgi:DNA-binding NarL/FixJ family response regulator